MPPLLRSVVADIAKRRDHCLSTAHPRGRAKAGVFQSRLGLRSGDAIWLRDALVDAVVSRSPDLLATGADEYGQRFALDFELTTAIGTATIRSAWMVRSTENVLRLIIPVC